MFGNIDYPLAQTQICNYKRYKYQGNCKLHRINYHRSFERNSQEMVSILVGHLV